MVKGIRLVGTAAGIVLALTGCGASDADATDGTATNAGASGASSAPTSSGASQSPRAQDQNEDPYHIAAADWPVDLSGAKALYAAMPAEFQELQAARDGWSDGAAGVTYGRANDGAAAWSMEAGEELPDARAALAVMFGMQMVCDKTTYRGTAEPMRGGLMPGFGSAEDVDPWWFACQGKGPKSGSFVIGWAHGDVGWIVDTPDEHTSRELLDAVAARTK